MVEKSHDSLQRKSDLLAAMANPRRLQILQILSLCDMTAGALAEKVGLSQSALSPHLAKLRSSGLIGARRYANNVYYSGCSDAVTMMLFTLATIFPGSVKDDIGLKHREAGPSPSIH